MKKYFRRYQIAIIAYCLMPNHYHFLLRQDGEVALSRVVGWLFNAYVLAVNNQQGRSGTLFEGRFRDVQVDKEGYLIHLCRYIHANPVKAGLVADPGEWPYSNYLEWVRERPGSLVDQEFVETYFPTSQGSAYREFVLDYLRDVRSLPEDIRGYLFE
jgi:REP element-mobilizing transposase RayT